MRLCICRWPALLAGGTSPRTEVVHQVSNQFYNGVSESGWPHHLYAHRACGMVPHAICHYCAVSAMFAASAAAESDDVDDDVLQPRLVRATSVEWRSAKATETAAWVQRSGWGTGS